MPIGSNIYEVGLPVIGRARGSLGLAAMDIVVWERVTWAMTCTKIGNPRVLDKVNLQVTTLQVLRREDGLSTGTRENPLQKCELRLPREERTDGLLVITITNFLPILATVEPIKVLVVIPSLMRPTYITECWLVQDTFNVVLTVAPLPMYYA